MKAVVHQAFGDVFGLDTARCFELTHVEDALVGDAAVCALVDDGKGALELFGDVVGVEDRQLRRLPQADRSHQAQVRP